MQDLRIYNTLARKKQIFSPIKPGKVGMYVCGMTVYDYCHLGHGRVMVVFDMVQHWLRQLGFDVTYVRNITDIDDKILKRASENGESISQLTERFIRAMDEDAAALGVRKPDYEPRATAFVPQMLSLIKRLKDKGLAYQGKNGDVNYSVRAFNEYGKLSGKSIDDLWAGERIKVNSNKYDPLDFVLWKISKDNETKEVKWNSTWGQGRPGWHIECSAMAEHFLGEHIDIHGGGQDLQFPHHENEIAQSEGVYDHKFVSYWMHNGFVRINDEKMSKSSGNFFTIRDILKRYNAEVMRFFILRTHYRSPLNYGEGALEDAKNGLNRLYTALKEVPEDDLLLDWNESYAMRVYQAMNDDFNTPIVISILFELANNINRSRSQAASRQLKKLAGVLGLLQHNPENFLKGRISNKYTSGRSTLSSGVADEDILFKIYVRREAKIAKNFLLADQIRQEMLDKGILLEDTSDGRTEWRRV